MSNPAEEKAKKDKSMIGKAVNGLNQLQSGTSSKVPTNFNPDKNVLKYPLDLESANGHYMIFNIYARTDNESDLPGDDANISSNSPIYNANFNSERFFDAKTDMTIKGHTLKVGKNVQMIKDSIVLYMPDDISVNYKANYEGAEIGLLVAGGTSIADFMKGNTGGADMAKGMGLQFAKTIEPLIDFGTLGTAQGLNALIQRKSGLAAAPMMEMVFQGVDFRTFNYSFKMTPRNREEAREVKRIIDTFTFHMLPEKLGTGTPLAFRVPSEFTIRYMYRGMNNNYLNKMTFCALTDMKVEYGAGEKFVTFRPDEQGAPPVQTNVSLTFQELEIIDKRRFNNTFTTKERPPLHDY